MRFIEELCRPALLYLMYIVVHVGLDLSLGMYLMALSKVIFGFAGVLLLDVFCEVDLGIVSWAIIAMPFIITALATSIALGLNLDHLIVQTVQEHFSPNPEGVKKLSAGDAPLSTSAMY